MRLLRLARAAFEAEGLHLRRLARARGIQAAFAAAAAVFALLLLLMLHLAVFAALVPGHGPVVSALFVAAGDLVLVGLLVFLASRAGHDPVAEEALRVRQEAVRQIGDGAARLVVLAPLLRSQTAKKGMLGAALTALVVGLLSRR
jgi:hypothetical protein